MQSIRIFDTLERWNEAQPSDVTASATAYQNTYCMGKRPFLFLLLIYMQFLTIFCAKTVGLSFIADYDSERV